MSEGTLDQVLAGEATWCVIHGDCLERMRLLPDNSMDASVSDPPYHLTSASRGGSPRTNDPEKPHGRHAIGSKGFMGKAWDGGDVALRPETWAEVFRVLKPGAHLVAFGGTRTAHRLACAIEDAGFEIRDQLSWNYGSGFPKSHNVSKAIDERDFRAWRKANAPAADLWKRTQARAKELAGTGKKKRGRKLKSRIDKLLRERAGLLREIIGSYTASGNAGTPLDEKGGTYGVGVESSDAVELYKTRGATEKSLEWDGWGTALKPSHEPIILARKPLEKGLSVAENVLKWGTGALNIDAARVAAGCQDRAESERKNQHAVFDSGPRENTVLGKDERPRPDYGMGDGRWPPNALFTHDARCQRIGTVSVAASPTWDTPNRKPPTIFGSEVPRVSATRHANGRDGEATADKRYADEGSTDFAPLPGARRDDTEDVDMWECVVGCPVRELAGQSGGSLSSGGTATGGKRGHGFGHDGSALGSHAGGLGDAGSAARYFPQLEWSELDDIVPFIYAAKAARAERDAGLDHFKPRDAVDDGARNLHPTIKPWKEVLCWLVKLATPPRGAVLDHFAGAGSCGIACVFEGFRYVGIELLDTDEEPHVSTARARIHHAEGREFKPRPSLRAAKAPAQGNLFDVR